MYKHRLELSHTLWPTPRIWGEKFELNIKFQMSNFKMYFTLLRFDDWTTNLTIQFNKLPIIMYYIGTIVSVKSCLVLQKTTYLLLRCLFNWNEFCVYLKVRSEKQICCLCEGITEEMRCEIIWNQTANNRGDDYFSTSVSTSIFS